MRALTRYLPFRIAAACAVALSAAACSGGDSAPSSSGLPTGAVTTDTLQVTSVDVSNTGPTTVLQAPFAAVDRDARRLVRAVLMPSAVSDRVFVGQSIVCTSADGLIRTSPELGRELDAETPASTPLVTELVLTTADIGAWSCASGVRVCPSTGCGSDTDAVGRLEIAGPGSAQPSELSISAPLPSWAVSERAGSDDVLVRAGSPGAFTTTAAAPLDQGALDVSGFLALRVCTGDGLPSQCPGATPGGTVMTPTFTVTQSGAGCAAATASPEQGAISQQLLPGERFATASFVIPEFGLSTAAGCGPEVTVTMSVKVEGAPVVLQRGSADLPTALVNITPAAPAA